jgi:hypothetical protein
VKPARLVSAASISLVLTVLFPPSDMAQGTTPLARKIAFLRGRSVWVADTNGTNAFRLTDRSVQIDDFCFSPRLRYLAYSAIVDSAEEPGLWDSTETPPQRAVCSIVIVDLERNHILSRSDSQWVSINRWLNDDRLLYHESDGFAVGNSYIYDVHKDAVTELNAPDDRLWRSDISLDGSLELYVETQYLNKKNRFDLRCADNRTRSDTIVFSIDFSISDQAISNSRDRIAFLQVRDSSGRYFDVLWLYDLQKASFVSLYQGPANPKFADENNLAWSFQDRYVGMFFMNNGIIVDPRGPSTVVKVQGSDFSWIGDTRFLYTQNNIVYVYDLRSRSSKEVLRDAEKAVFLRQ